MKVFYLKYVTTVTGVGLFLGRSS